MTDPPPEPVAWSEGAPGDLLVANIGELVTNDPAAGAPPLHVRHDAAVAIRGGLVAWVGPEKLLPPEHRELPTLDAGGAAALPGFVDAHTHLVFAGDRADEFAARLSGQAYQAGGIRTTVAATRAASDDDLLTNARRLATEAARAGTTTIEVKSGYGLTVEDERRSLAVARDLPTPHRTFLGAHVVPEGSDPDDYTTLVAGDMLAACAPLATAADVFVEEGAFDVDQAREILLAAKGHGLDLHVHANQLRHGPGVQLAAEVGALSADHCTHLEDEDIGALRDADVTAVLVPAAEFSTRSAYAPARRLLDAGVTVALATDCNPGTSFTTSMPFVVALACRELGMTPEEAVAAATVGGAAALGADEVGRLVPNAAGDLVVLDAPTYLHLPYRPGVDLVSHTVKAGRLIR
ncbi:MAG: imidazolonepropionase [Nitriliruptorales bacterium]|nr:imidazolonepropionase [Nitriliruptorales bacterium]